MAKTEYLKTDEAKQFAEQQAAAAECEEVKSDEDEEPSADASSSTAKRKRRTPKQTKDPNGALPPSPLGRPLRLSHRA